MHDRGTRFFLIGLLWPPALGLGLAGGVLVCSVEGITWLHKRTILTIKLRRELRAERARQRSADQILENHLGGLAGEHPTRPLHEPLKLDIPNTKLDFAYRNSHCKECGQALAKKSA